MNVIDSFYVVASRSTNTALVDYGQNNVIRIVSAGLAVGRKRANDNLPGYLPVTVITHVNADFAQACDPALPFGGDEAYETMSEVLDV